MGHTLALWNLGSHDLGQAHGEIRKALRGLIRIKVLVKAKWSAGDRALIAVRE